MIITFCGHSRIIDGERLFDAVLSTIEKQGEGDVVFYLGGYGDFDAVAKKACLAYREKHPSARLVFVTPYPFDAYLRNREITLQDYDETLYPEIEKTPLRYAIRKRNEWMARQADLLIAYVDHEWGGAAKTLAYALSHEIVCDNLGKA